MSQADCSVRQENLRLVTVPTDPFINVWWPGARELSVLRRYPSWFNMPAVRFLSEWAKCQPGNTQNGGTILPIANLITDSESGSPDSYSSFLVTIRLSRLVSEIFTCDGRMDVGRMDNADSYYSWPPHCDGPANRWKVTDDRDKQSKEFDRRKGNQNDQNSYLLSVPLKPTWVSGEHCKLP